MRHKIYNIIITLLVPVVIFLLAETFFRAYLISPSQINSWGYNPAGFGDLLPNRDFIADEGPLPYRVVTNSQGLRSDREFSIPKSAGKFRVLAIGDSLTFGPYVNQQDSYPARLEQDLADLKIDTEVINAGIAGYTLEDELSYLVEKGIRLQPDLVILEVYQNDVSDYTPSTRMIYSRVEHKKTAAVPVYDLAKKSAVVTFFENLLANRRVRTLRQKAAINPDPTGFEKYYPAYFSDLEKLKQFSNQKGLPVLLVFIPSFDQVTGADYQPQGKIRETLGNDLPTLDLLPVFQREEFPKSLYLLPANGHLSAYGNFVTASAIASEIAKTYNR